MVLFATLKKLVRFALRSLNHSRRPGPNSRDANDSDSKSQTRDTATAEFEFDGSNLSIHFENLFGETFEFDGMQSEVLDMLDTHLRYNDYVKRRFVPLEENDEPADRMWIEENLDERYRKAIEYLTNHPQFINCNGSERARELWAETPYATDLHGLDQFERAFGLDLFGQRIRYNDEHDMLVQEIEWDFRPLVLRLESKGYDELISDLPDEPPEYARKISELRQNHT